jgi:hypothetical protein
MGYGRYDPSDWDTMSSTTKTMRADDIFTARTLKDPVDPKKMEFREARDSAANPNSTPIIVALDVTGSMGIIPEYMIKEGFGTLVGEIIKRAPVSDPQIMFMGVGDAHARDRAPLQITQFEPDIKAAEQLSQIWIEHGGGGNRFESYDLPWYFAAMKTRLDCVEKGRRKGLLFTIGDEQAPPGLTVEQLKKYLGDDVPQDMSSKDLLAKVEQMYDVFHVVVEQGDHCQLHRSDVYRTWNELLGQGRVIPLADYTKLSEVLVSAIEVHEGRSAPTVASSWGSRGTSLVVAKAVKDIVPANRNRPPSVDKPSTGGVTRLAG